MDHNKYWIREVNPHEFGAAMWYPCESQDPVSEAATGKQS